MKQNVFFKNMRRVLPLCMILLVSGLTSCKSNLDIETDQLSEMMSPLESSEEITSFFNLNEEVFINSFSSYFPRFPRDTCFMFNSRAELQEMYVGDKKIPEIDFDEKTLIIGMIMEPAGYSLESQALDITKDSIVVNFTMRQLKGAFVAMIYPYYFWGLYEKLPQKHLEITKNHINLR